MKTHEEAEAILSEFIVIFDSRPRLSQLGSLESFMAFLQMESF